MKIFLIGLFGVLGVYTRYFVDLQISQQQESFPMATLTVNMIGCFTAGVVYCFIFHKYPSNLLQPILIGFCGGLTTFSGYALQSLNFMTMDQMLKSFSYLILSPTLGMLLVLVGFQTSLHFFFSQN
ncbi:MAG: CrcB protein [Bacteriovoracaceae bacterium]|jgi:CrcB protein